VADLGPLDIVVNNAGVMLLGPVDEAPLDEWQRMVSLNLGGLLNIAHAAIPHLLTAADAEPRRVADLVNVSSVAGRVARPGAAVYDLTKFGVGGFSESGRQEFARRHLRVAVVEPGVVRTELTDHIRDGVREAARERLSTIEGLEPEDVADAIAYIVTRPRRLALNEVVIRPTEQDW
jgi:NADP-dependent 3-hydroxy acid dehydrogenase YdfG